MRSTSTRHLTFVATTSQATSVAKRWTSVEGQRTVICLDEAILSSRLARQIFDDDVEIHGLSDLGLRGEDIIAEALSLADDIFPEREADPVARVERWMMESMRHWLIYAVHSGRLVETAFDRFQPGKVWLPDFKPMYLSISHDEQPDNPLFFDLLPALCRRRRVEIESPRPASGREVLKRAFLPVKFVVGQWLSGLKSRRAKARNPETLRPVLLSNVDNDLHRQFDLSRLGDTAKLMFAWLRAGENVVPLERLFDRVAPPETTQFGWLTKRTEEVDEIAIPAGAHIRAFAGLRFLVGLLRSERHHYQRRTALEEKYGLPWWQLLFQSEIPYIHRECRLAGAFYCLYEYERTRAVLHRWKPELFVISNYWTDLPKVAAAKDLGITAMMTSAGINFLKDDFAQRSAPIVCVYGEAEAIKTKEFHPEVRIIRGGDVLVGSKTSSTKVAKCERLPRIVVATSARMFGWWFGSLFFDYNPLVKAFRELALLIRSMEIPLEVVIKSHPVSDLHDFYDQLVVEFGDVFVEHRKAPITLAEAAEFDAAVVFSAATTFLAELIRARVPVIYFNGALTTLGKSYFDYQGLLVAEDVPAIIEKLSHMLGEQQANERDIVLKMGNDFLQRYVDPGRRSFKSVIEELLSSDALVSLANQKPRMI